MTPGDLPAVPDVMKWAGGLIVIAGGILGVRYRKSADDTRIARNVAEAGIYSKALSDMTTDRNGWRDAHRELERLYSEARAALARAEAREEARQTEIVEMRTRHAAEQREMQRQISILRAMVGRIADPETRRILGSEFARSQPGGLDEVEEGKS